jgi:hypothetical protein
MALHFLTVRYPDTFITIQLEAMCHVRVGIPTIIATTEDVYQSGW